MNEFRLKYKINKGKGMEAPWRFINSFLDSKFQKIDLLTLYRSMEENLYEIFKTYFAKKKKYIQNIK